jgi:hypothetical protein
MGLRANPAAEFVPMGCRNEREFPARPKVVAGHLDLPRHRSGYRKERDGLTENRHLHDLAESIVVNVGGRGRHATVSSPPTAGHGVGAVIVLRARESRVHGEGRQLVDLSTQNTRMLTGMKFL